MEPDISWLLGRRLVAVEKSSDWVFRLDDGGFIRTGVWRIASPGGVVITSEDHDQKFGLPAPVNAAQVAREAIGELAATGYSLDSRTGDLSIDFGSLTLQFLCLSVGYEQWESRHKGQHIICVGGGQIAVFNPPK